MDTSINIAAASIRDISINRSCMKGRGLVIPQVALTPFLIAANTAVPAPSRPNMPAEPAKFLLYKVPESTSLTVRFDIGAWSATFWAKSSMDSGPRKKLSPKITARVRGNNEKRA